MAVTDVHVHRYYKWFLFDDETVSEEDIMPKGKTLKASSSRSTNGKDGKILTPRAQGPATVPGSAFYGSSSQSSRKEALSFSPAGLASHQDHITVDDSDSDGEKLKRPILKRTYKSTSSDIKKKRRISEESDAEHDDGQSSSEQHGANMYVAILIEQAQSREIVTYSARCLPRQTHQIEERLPPRVRPSP